MESVAAVFHDGRIELVQPVDWPDGTQVEVRPLQPQTSRLRRRVNFPLIHSAQPGTLSADDVRAAEDAANLQEDAARADTM
jgi:hypothetical protein